MNARTLWRGGLLALAAALLALAASPWTTVAAQDLPPRPTVVPTPPPAPTDAPADESGGDELAPVGRITGTVIDQTDGSPVAGARVQVADAVITSDANGNYDLAGLAAGSYLVTLLSAEGRGLPAQAPITVSLAAGATVVQHLAFLALPASAPVAPAPAEPALIPAALPATGEGDLPALPAGVAAALLLAGAALTWGGQTAVARGKRSS